MASGKSAVGRALASRLGWRFVDLDDRIVERTGRSIPELFEEGEEHFRAEERRALEEVLDERRCIIALGGGVLTWRDTLDRVLASGLLVCLEADVDSIVERLGAGEVERPVLEAKRGEALRMHIRRLLDARRHYYEAAAVTVSTGGRSIETIVEELYHVLHGRLAGDPG